MFYLVQMEVKFLDVEKDGIHKNVFQLNRVRFVSEMRPITFLNRLVL